MGSLGGEASKTGFRRHLISMKARTRLWTLRRLMKLGFNENFLIDVYIKDPYWSIIYLCGMEWSYYKERE